MTVMLESRYKVVTNEQKQKVEVVVLMTEVEVTADTDEDSLEEVLEAISDIVDELYDLDNMIDRNWNSKKIFGIADKLAA